MRELKLIATSEFMNDRKDSCELCTFAAKESSNLLLSYPGRSYALFTFTTSLLLFWIRFYYIFAEFKPCRRVYTTALRQLARHGL